MDASSSSPDNAKPKLINGKIVWSGGPSMRQHFALPESIMYYMAMNPSSAEVYKKLIQTSKYFFEKNPILVAEDICNIYGVTEICSNIECRGFGVCCVKIDLKKISSKFWFTNGLYLHDNDTQYSFSMLCSKIYRCENSILTLYNQHLMYDEFKFLASSATNVTLGNVKITNNDGSTVMLEKILEAVPKIENFFSHVFASYCIFI
uniref:Uncharacterized protein n=1 Tax=Panagrolaimus sp. ES5 TaxID=591445 RepID=A0AC34FLZ3_9BILA